MDLFDASSPGGQSGRQGHNQPLATRMRPVSITEFAGQKHLTGEGKLLRRMIESGRIGSMIFYGPPSCGKTTLAHVISREVDADFVTLNAVLDGVKEFRNVVAKADEQRKLYHRKTVLFVDEIHRWNKAQQDALLPHIESGLITLIGATTLNPFYSLVGPLLSRCQLFELFPFQAEDIKQLIHRALADEERGMRSWNVYVTPDAVDYFTEYSGGDIRHALNALEMAILTSRENNEGKKVVDESVAKESIQKRYIRYDRTGDEHYHFASAMIKSLRGSDPDASLYWLTAMIEGGEDPHFVFRRLLIFASEDVGLADPHALSVVNSAHEAFQKCGMPEGFYFLSQACLHLALAPKSNSTGAIFGVVREHKEKGTKPVPDHLRDKTANAKKARYLDAENASDNYKYPHSYPDHWVDQQYLPDSLTDARWFQPGNQGLEARRWERLMEIKKTAASGKNRSSG
ncbi:replication-associated recombination protein A [Natronogracilivirga saccharolytica]|uniref:Replication-associated recombination protein A n=1 Tax=Natronogracilivirga saccharolytica TaxID=2812953 RepID=A0A8J7RHR6_9BACT|nr:replication-associated recombination protein A [Natronogracilivirga saccharolytica]MBP3191422.1 replication-associated recombination protein A [Natronogracilivirga saccharolytica]